MSKKSKSLSSFLEKQEYLGFRYGEQRWRSHDRKRLYTWDSLHGEIEVFNSRGHHLGVLEPLEGRLMKSAVKGRKIRV
ncbi:MAG: colicin E3/pyocin S6 family cytotoxin [Gammaproteobacteria bacterium]|nr:colicin E3/pyocin S6 family cytotoxin [Gammaproteobacteria bacterium]MDE0285160.1 colicin E3/pyocin S6 family cytotoxin [Gammaproteobacteria bacterium]